MARTTTDETTPALVARGVFAISLLAGYILAAALAACDSAWIARQARSPRHQADIDDVQAAGAMLNLGVEVAKAGSERELDAAFVRLLQRNARALIIAGDAFFLFQREQIVALAARHAIPAMYNTRDFVIAGGLMSYGASLTDAARQAGPLGR